MQTFNLIVLSLATIASLGACAVLEKRQESCNQDNCYRQMEQKLDQASTFCPTFMAGSSAAAALPTFVPMCQGLLVTSRLSSACACLVPTTPAPITATATTTPATTAALLACDRDNCFRQLQASSSQASEFCPTYTLGPATAPIPIFANNCGGLASRISSACSCLYPKTNTIPIDTVTSLTTESTSVTTSSSATASATAISCSDPPVRKEWRSLSTPEKDAYIDAVLCLTNTDAISRISGIVNRYDDFHAVHNNQTPNIHWVGHFILWHRYITAAYEAALRDECGYTGGQPYWDWARDADTVDPNSTAIFETDIFSPTVGFDGNGRYIKDTTPEQNPFGLTGRTGGGCVTDGPFAYPAFQINYPGPATCLTRDFIPTIMNTFAAQENVDVVMAQPDYTAFAKQIENEPIFSIPNIHGSGHFGVGGVLGTIGNAYNSPGDPLFYLHHVNLDRVLTEWQNIDLEQRLNEVGGPIIPFDYSGDNVTLDFTINLSPIAPAITLKEALNAQGDTFCYTYDTLL
ncbi:hypothetical protein ONS95_009173 [Cadophora gregata]|uniref:uncharacterized protein n=1 Tax=Cadophora gregata TaxID=51156 RepID=UPI0026DBD41F|nr:uncharacterized protein ONS95_009173 [Cadophora gregata]KAK0124192.1 hypothetical protein ONS95_009173 [Cadophora gregata]